MWIVDCLDSKQMNKICSNHTCVLYIFYFRGAGPGRISSSNGFSHMLWCQNSKIQGPFNLAADFFLLRRVREMADIVDDPPPWRTNPNFRTRANSPTSHPSKSNIWKTVLRLCSDHPLALTKDGYTHICTEEGCGYALKLNKPKDKEYWTNTPAINHVRRAHPESSGKEFVKSSTVSDQIFL